MPHRKECKRHEIFRLSFSWQRVKSHIWNMAHVEDGEKYYIRKEYTEVSELHKGSEQPVIIQQVPQQTEPAAGEEPQNGQEEKEGVNNAS